MGDVFVIHDEEDADIALNIARAKPGYSQ